MRQIKFRYWYANEKKMAYDIRMLFPMYSNHPIAMQFTGLQDSQGVDIWEGDVVTFSYVSGYVNTSVVEWRNSGAKFVTGSNTMIEARIYTVIGNIYESPELMK